MLSSIEMLFESEDESENLLRVERRNIRDGTDVFAIPNAEFIHNFRLNKEAFKYVLSKIEDSIGQTYRSTAIPPMLKLGMCLRFFGQGSYQLAVGNDHYNCMAQSTVSKILSECLPVLEAKLCSEWIKIQMTEIEERSTKQHYFRTTGIPGIVGCVDGTHIKIMAPNVDRRHLYYNRKGFYSINAMVVCDNNLYIKYIDARYPGANHDSFIWNSGKCNEYFNKQYDEGKENTWLLGDAGYPLLPYLITPFRNTTEGSAQAFFNTKHGKARNCIERCIGVLKNRFRCILGERGLHYKPRTATQIINVCCALHNICKFFQIEDPDINTYLQENVHQQELSTNEVFNTSHENRNLSHIASDIRNRLLTAIQN